MQVVATVRSGAPVPAGVDQIWRTPLGARLELQPLGTEEVGELISSVLGGPVDGATAALVDRASSGLPLLVLELIAHGRESGRLALRSGLWQWSGELGDRLPAAGVLGLSVDQVSDAARDLLQLVVLTDPTPVVALEAAGPPAAIAELDAHRLIKASDDVSVVRPAHPLLAEQVAAGISPLRRRRLLRQ